MKIALLGDTHFGVRNDARHFHEYYEKFYSEVFFPYLEEHGINTIIQLTSLTAVNGSNEPSLSRSFLEILYQ